MDFDSPDVEKDFPGLYASEGSGRSKKDDKDCRYLHLQNMYVIIEFILLFY